MTRKQTQKLYYTNARFDHKTALLAGPFLTADDAGKYIDVCGPLFIIDFPAMEHATYGVLEVNAFAGYGQYNLALIAAGATDVPLPGCQN